MSLVDDSRASAAFQVDLAGVVDLLSRHLYSSPKVYLRELLQNGVDAITARAELPQGAGRRGSGRIELRPLPGGGLEVRDTGIGLTLDEARELLATIGRSSKRDLEVGAARHQFLGQFGIGLLSAFMVSDEVELVSRSARDRQAPTVLWRGRSDGRYDLAELPTDDPRCLDEPGSVVRLAARRDLEHWLAPSTVETLARDFGELLPVELVLVTDEPDGSSRRTLSHSVLPWLQEYASPRERERALREHCRRTLGFTPLAAIDLDLPVAGVSGVAYVLPTAVSPTTSSSHRVYLKKMLLGTGVDDLLPPWAFFVRCVLDATALRPTASREDLYEDEVLLAVRDGLGRRIRGWTIDTLRRRDPGAAELLTVHHLAVRALALVDDDMLDLAVEVLPFECTTGPSTVAGIRREHGTLRYASTVEEFRRISPVAHAQDLPVLNAGYVYDADLMARIARRHPDWDVVPLTSADVAGVLGALDAARDRETAEAVAALRGHLEGQGCTVELRQFGPTELPAMFLPDRDGEHGRRVAEIVDGSSDLWGDVLGAFNQTSPPPRTLVLNDANPVVQDLLRTSDDQVRRAGVHSLYVTALLLSGSPLTSRESHLMNDALSVLLRTAAGSAADGDAR